jgi:hypothetical protein
MFGTMRSLVTSNLTIRAMCASEPLLHAMTLGLAVSGTRSQVLSAKRLVFGLYDLLLVDGRDRRWPWVRRTRTGQSPLRYCLSIDS